MLYKFKSKHASDVLMLEPTGRRVLQIIGKDAAAPQGIILPEHMSLAIEALQQAIAQEESGNSDTHLETTLDTNPDTFAEGAPGLRQRAMPFIAMLQRNHQAGGDVVWGV